MKTLLLLAMFLASGLGSSLQAAPETRNLLQFGDMIKCMTERSSANYIAYGCWCGKGGKGTPVDATDQCCKNHDNCYQRLLDDKACSFWDLYIKTYTSSCSNCGSSSPTITCEINQSACGLGLCSCDSTAAQCFRSAPYNSKYTWYWNLFC